MPPLKDGAYRLQMTVMDNARNTTVGATNLASLP